MKYFFASSIALAGVVVGLPHNAAPRAEDPEVPTELGLNRFFISKSCTEAEQKQITESFHDSQKLADALKTWEPAGKNQDVMDTYMGTNSSASDYREILKNNINREAALYQPPQTTDDRLYIMCHVDIYYNKDIETKCPPDGVYAWTWTNPGSARSDQYMTFCPLFFISPTLATDVQKGQNNKDAIKFMDGFDTNTAATFFHESFHMENTVGNPPIWDNPDGVAEAGVYGSGPTADLAEKRNTAATMLVAECYTMAGLAIYYRDTLGLSYFPKPKGQTGGTFIRKKLANPGATQGASDPNDPNSQPSDDWIPLS